MKPAERERLVVWSGVEEWRAEACSIHFSPDGMTAAGTQIGASPIPYRMDYRLDASDGFVTRRLEVQAAGDGWSRNLVLTHDGEGQWQAEVRVRGDVDLPEPGGDVGLVAGALDCDLGLCPATNSMPVVRHRIHRVPASRDFLMAWVSVPALQVRPSQQRYEHRRLTPQGSVVRYVGAHRGFAGDLEFDSDGIVIYYPELARRVTG